MDEAKKNGLSVWLYDEDRWPSGGAAGRVCWLGQDAFRCKGITLEVCRDSEKAAYGGVIAAYGVRISPDDPMAAVSCRRLAEHKKYELLEGETLVLAREEVSGRNTWFHNEAPADLLNPAAVSCFIHETHDQYERLIGDEFGGTVKGIFTDEPSLADRRASFPADRGWMPWTWGLEEYFLERRGYDILSRLPFLYFSGVESRKVRHDYWRTIAERFSESYTKQIGEWCERHNIAFTGHFLQENRLGLCTRVNGAVMPHYQYQQVPGIDWLGEQTEEYITVKQCASVARQMGRQRVITETYAGCGWDFTFEGQKWVGDFQFVLGVNERCLHLAFYSLKGMRKRDYPPSFHYNNTWWEKNRVVENYFARLSLMLTQGEPVRDILILHPAGTAWELLGASPYGNPVRRRERDVPAVDAYGDWFNALLERLCREHYDYDLGDESLLASLGRVENGCFYVGAAGYRIVIVPAMETVFKSTKELLERFMGQGGSVILEKPVPKLVETVRSDEPLWTSGQCCFAETQEKIIKNLEMRMPRKVSVVVGSGEEASDILYQLRRTDDGYTLFLVNNNRERAVETEVVLGAEIAEITGEVVEWNLLTGGREEVGCGRGSDGSIRFPAVFGEAESRLYVIGEKTAGASGSGMDGKKVLSRKIWSSPDEAPVSYKQKNLLVLNRCRYRLREDMSGGEWEAEGKRMEGQSCDIRGFEHWNCENWSQELRVWEAQKAIRERLRMRPTCLNGGEQWYCWADEKCPGDNTDVDLEFFFDMEEVPDRIDLVLEEPKSFRILFNDTVISSKSTGYFLDRSFEKVPLPRGIKGRNSIRLSCKYTSQTELENCYLLGDFGIRLENGPGNVKNKVMEKLPERLFLGDWTRQGLPYYCGSLRYHYNVFLKKTSGRLYFQIGEFKAACATLRVNYSSFEIPWKAAGRVDITEAVTAGENHLEVELYGTPVNMLGPFTNYKQGETVIGSSVFMEEGDADYLKPYGLFSPCEVWVETEDDRGLGVF